MTQLESSDVGIRHYLGVLRRRKLVVGLTALLVVSAALGASLLQTPVYQAHADLLIKEPATLGSSSVFTPSNQPQTDVSVVVGTQIEIVTSRPVRDAVTKSLGGNPKVTATQVGQTDVVRLTASSISPPRAATIVNAWAKAYIDFTRTQDINSDVAATSQIQTKIDDLQKQIDALDAKVTEASPTSKASVVASLSPQRNSLVTQQGVLNQRLNQLQVEASLRSGAAQLVTSADTPKRPSSPKPVRNAAFGVLAGILIGVGIALILDYFDDSISSSDDLDRATRGLPNLAQIPLVSNWKAKDQPQVVSRDDPSSSAAEAYRTLRTSIQFAGLDRPARIIQVSSPNAQEGKTTTISNLGVALANSGQRVCLCCCDLRRPRIHEFFGLDNAIGLTSVILGERSLSQAVQAVPYVEGLFLLASGPQPANPSELLASPRAAEVIRALSVQYDIVLVDCPPILPVTDAAVIATFVDVTVLTVAADATARRDITRAMELLEQVHAPLIGSVLNGISNTGAGGYYHYRRYGSYPSASIKGGGSPDEQWEMADVDRRRRRPRRVDHPEENSTVAQTSSREG